MKKLKFTLPWWTVPPLILLFTLSTTVLSVAVQPGSVYQSLYDIISRPITVFLNTFPILILVALGYFIAGNVFYGASVTSLIALLLSYVNLLKIEGRDDAFVPADIPLFREAMSAASSYDLDLHIPLLLFLIFYCALIFTIGVFIKTPRPRVWWRVASGVVVAAAFLLSMKFVYPDKDRYNELIATTPAMYNIPSVFNTLGFNYCFLYNVNLYPVDKPEGYSDAQIKNWEKEYAKTPAGTDSPNIIMVMGEAFSDISNEDVFAWENDEQNPAYKYNLLANSERAVSGHIVVSNIAAGTANTEFDILTGTPTTMLSDTTTSSFRVVNKPVSTVASVLRDKGYSTAFMHPGDSWFYNRSSVYKYFGVDNQTFIEAFDINVDTTGGLVTDEAFLRELKKVIANNNSPQFVYSVTIQNHQSYSYAKYADISPAVPLDRPISDMSMEILSTYMRGVRDTSEMIYQLAEYLDTLSEPTLLVFFGDHLPNLGDSVYNELGLPMANALSTEDVLATYTTPYMIYGNTAYCDSHDMQAVANDCQIQQGGTVNNIYLGAMTLDLAGFSGADPYFDFLNYARRELPVFRTKENAYQLKDGTFTDALTDPSHLDIIKKIDHWQYYKIR